MLCNEVRFYIPRDVLLSPSYEVFVLTSAHIWWVTSFLGIIFTQYKSTGQRQDAFQVWPAAWNTHEMEVSMDFPFSPLQRTYKTNLQCVLHSLSA